MPIFLVLLKDEVPEVRLALFKNLGDLNSVVPLETIHQHILPVFQELASDKNWRLRLQAMDTFYLLATYMAGSFLKQPSSVKFLSDWLGDKYFSVRDGAIDLLYRLSKALGAGFLEKTALPQLLALQSSQHYLYRMTFLFGITVTSFHGIFIAFGRCTCSWLSLFIAPLRMWLGSFNSLDLEVVSYV